MQSVFQCNREGKTSTYYRNSEFHTTQKILNKILFFIILSLSESLKTIFVHVLLVAAPRVNE